MRMSEETVCPEINSCKSQNRKNELISEAYELQAKAWVLHGERLVTK